MQGCPKHHTASRKCPDVRCLQTWKPEGAPTSQQQLEQWAQGNSICPNEHHDCCPDFSCCCPEHGWSLEKRQKFMSASQGEREKMMMGALGTLLSAIDKKVYISRGDPTDRE